MTTATATVVGGGRMGTGIAHALLTCGMTVTIVDGSPELADSARMRVVDMVRASAERGVLDGDVGEVVARLSAGVGPEVAAGSSLVVEAVPEDPALKLRVLAGIESVVEPDTLIGTNTSSISVTELSLALAHPDRFLGLHFFNPVPASALVEIVVGSATSDVALEQARTLVAAIGKTGIVVRDSPGFASSRLGVMLGLEAIRMVEEGVAAPEDIDAAMTLGYKHPVGPLRLTDMVGLDVRLGVAEYLASALGERFEPPALMRKMVARGDLGQKSGRGFYTWE